MSKLAIQAVTTKLDPDELMNTLCQASSPDVPEMFLISASKNSYHTLRITESPKYYRSKTDLFTLVKLILAHPAFSVRPGLITPLHAQMLQLLGIDNETIEAIREELTRNDYIMIITPEAKAKLKKMDNVNLNRTFNIKLHSNFRNMIKKASLNLFQIPVIPNYAERLAYDYTF